MQELLAVVDGLPKIFLMLMLMEGFRTPLCRHFRRNFMRHYRGQNDKTAPMLPRMRFARHQTRKSHGCNAEDNPALLAKVPSAASTGFCPGSITNYAVTCSQRNDCRSLKSGAALGPLFVRSVRRCGTF
jgi:hypothetical protein